MKLGLQPLLSDPQIDLSSGSNQRQLSISVQAIPEPQDEQLPLNLCLILDHSGSMKGTPLETVKDAACQIVAGLKSGDRISVVAFDHEAKVIVENQPLIDPTSIISKIKSLKANGGTAIDEGIKLGIMEMAKGMKDTVSHAFILTDGENEHGDNNKCIKLAELATEKKITLNTLGFGEHWNQNILEKIADVAGGTLAYIEKPDQAINEFSRIFTRIAAVGLTNAYLEITLMPKVRLAELKPVAQVSPDTIELPVEEEDYKCIVRLGDIMKDVPRVILVNTYIGQLAEGRQTISTLQVRYDDPSIGQIDIRSAAIPVEVDVTRTWQPTVNPVVQNHTLALAKYRQTQLAEQKLQQGDRQGAATLLQTAAKTAIQMGDRNAATVLQTSATQLQSGEELSEADKKKTRMVSKTILQ